MELPVLVSECKFVGQDDGVPQQVYVGEGDAAGVLAWLHIDSNENISI